jgi:hypothetical protein
MRKGQVEFVAVIGIVVVAVIVIYLGFQALAPPTPAPTAVAQEQKTVRDSLLNFMTSGAQEVLDTMSDHGGFLGPQANSVIHLGREVPFWQLSGVANFPNIQSNFVQGLTSYLRDNRASLEAMFEGRNVTIGDPIVTATFLDNQIQVNVNMPTSVKNYPITQPYTFTVQTRISQIDRFAKAFINTVSSERSFEYFTMSSMLLSPPGADSIQEVPVSVMLFTCGQFVHKSWNDVRPGMEAVIERTLANIYMPGKAPLNIGDVSPSPKYGLPSIGGQFYSDLEVNFFTPDDFGLSRDTFQFTPEPITARAVPIPMTGACVSEPVQVNYFVTYPAVVEVRDTLTDNLFRFAFQVYIKDNEPGPLADITGYATADQAQLCRYPQCSGSVIVEDSAGNPVPGADISFMGCGFTAGATGSYDGLVPCGMGTLTVNAEGFSPYEMMTSSDELAAYVVTLHRQPSINMEFFEVHIQNDSIQELYYIDDVTRIRHELQPDETVLLSFYNRELGQMEQRIYSSASATETSLAPATYLISGGLADSRFERYFGNVGYEFTIREDTTKLYVYLPYMVGFDESTQEMRAGTAYKTSKMMAECGVPTVTEAPVDSSAALGCSKTYAEFKAYEGTA